MFLPWFDKWVQLSLNLQVNVRAGWRFYWAVVDAVLLNNAKWILWYCRRDSWFFRSWRKTPQTHDKNQTSRFATEPVHGNETCCGILCVLGCLSPLSWTVVRFIVPPFHLWFPCLLNIFNTIKCVKNESKTHTIMLWVGWREVCIAVQIWLCCGHWGKKQSS